MSISFLIIFYFSILNCNEPAVNPDPDPQDTIIQSEIDCWLTTKDGLQLLQKQEMKYSFNSPSNFYEFIEVDSAVEFQSIDGFGYTLTGGSAKVINQLNTADRQQLLEELFGKKDFSIGISYLRLSSEIERPAARHSMSIRQP